MLDLMGLATVGIAFFIMAASPGPATLATAAVSMQAGRQGGLRFGLGLSVGLALWGFVAATGMGAILQSSVYALTVFRILGGAYLLWLAFKAGRAALAAAPTANAPKGAGRWFRRGLVLNLSNPKAVVAWMAALSLGIEGSSSVLQVSLATLICCILGGLIYVGYATLFSISGVMRTYKRLHRWVDGLVAGFFAIAGLGLLRSAFSR